MDDEGWYTCVVEDENREKFSETAYLSVVSLAAAKPTAFDTLVPTDELKPKKVRFNKNNHVLSCFPRFCKPIFEVRVDKT